MVRVLTNSKLSFGRLSESRQLFARVMTRLLISECGFIAHKKCSTMCEANCGDWRKRDLEENKEIEQRDWTLTPQERQEPLDVQISLLNARLQVGPPLFLPSSLSLTGRRQKGLRLGG